MALLHDEQQICDHLSRVRGSIVAHPDERMATKVNLVNAETSIAERSRTAIVVDSRGEHFHNRPVGADMAPVNGRVEQVYPQRDVAYGQTDQGLIAAGSRPAMVVRTVHACEKCKKGKTKVGSPLCFPVLRGLS